MTNPTVAVVTVTTNRPELIDSINSMDEQTYPVHHYLLTDGIVDYDEYWQMVAQYRSEKRDVAYWPKSVAVKTPKGGSGGQKLFAAAPHFITEDILIMTADDDWFKPNHVESLVTLMVKDNLDWAYSLRGIYDKQKNFLFDDNCESLGEHPVWNDGDGFAETGSIAAKTHAYCDIAAIYNFMGFGADRYAYHHLKKRHPKFAGTGLHTNCFRLGGNPNSVKREFFEKGNAVMKQRYPERFPWHPPPAYQPGLGTV